MNNTYSDHLSRGPDGDGDELDLTPEQVQKYFKMLREVEFGYKGRPVIISPLPMSLDHFYELFISQTNREN